MLLRDYLDRHNIAVATFAERLDVSVATVYRYLAGDRRPRAELMARICELTGGRVQPNDWFAKEAAE
jgi:transcriptional regulator with XRE-family HTH domain